MKLLIAYDGSRFSEAALDDLARAGLPDKGQALVVSVAEVWLPLPNHNGNGNGSGFSLGDYSTVLVERHREKGEKALTEAKTFAKHAQNRLKVLLPDWNITAESTYGSPAWEILAKADEFDPDLIVVGSQGQSAVSRVLLGSISQSILTRAKCSVRIARGKVEVDDSPMRIVIGFDGSLGAQAAVRAVAGRSWPEQSEIRLVSAADQVMPTAIGRFIPPVAGWAQDEFKAQHEWMEKLAAGSIETLNNSGYKTALQIVEGNPKQVLTGEAENWHADAIFVGANTFGSSLERFLIGSVSAAVAARARCSVEVVREPERK